ncbi:MAG: gamma-glutamyl-gamma-aminobutyrate hydrolase family protein [Alphaproteobacteria bacterium]
MTLIAVSQRVVVEPSYAERRDALDQAWPRFLAACGLTAIAVPNVPSVATGLVARLPIAGLLLTGGNDLAAYGGTAPERDETERLLLEWAGSRGLPTLGVCRGMQVILDAAGIPLRRVTGHVTPAHPVTIDGREDLVNSYHAFAATGAAAPFQVWATAADGVVEAIRAPERRTVAIMWHPERAETFAERDIALFRDHFRP